MNKMKTLELESFGFDGLLTKLNLLLPDGEKKEAAYSLVVAAKTYARESLENNEGVQNATR